MPLSLKSSMLAFVFAALRLGVLVIASKETCMGFLGSSIPSNSLVTLKQDRIRRFFC